MYDEANIYKLYSVPVKNKPAFGDGRNCCLAARPGGCAVPALVFIGVRSAEAPFEIRKAVGFPGYGAAIRGASFTLSRI